MFPTNSECLIGVSDAYSAFVYGYPSSCPRAHCTPNKSVPTLRYTRMPGPVYTGHACRHLPSAVPWISEDRLLVPAISHCPWREGVMLVPAISHCPWRERVMLVPAISHCPWREGVMGGVPEGEKNGSGNDHRSRCTWPACLEKRSPRSLWRTHIHVGEISIMRANFHHRFFF